MRPRLAVPLSLLAALVVAALPSAVAAAPHHNHGLTINATPDPIITGDAVLIYGQLNKTPVGGQTITLYHRVNPATHFTIIGTTTTNSTGFYEFTREEGVVLSNRSWFVRGPGSTHSRTVHEHVAAALTLAASSATADTNHPITFTGHIDPAGHAGERVILQSQEGGSGDDWRTIGSGLIDGSSNYAIPHRFLQPGARDVRVVFRGDALNIKAESDPVSVVIDQTQVPDFTIATSSPNIDEGSMVTISGILYMPGSTTLPEPATSVTLWGHQDNQKFQPLGSMTTGTDGGYSFTQSPTHNEVYQVRTTFTPPKRRHTAKVFEGVRDVVSITASSMTAVVGQTITFQGTVMPNKTGHVVYLQRLAADHDYHTIKVGHVKFGSTYLFKWEFGSAGTKTFRVLVPGGPENVSGHSGPVVVTVTLPPVNSLPPAS